MNEIILKIVDRFPTWYLMLIVSIIIFYKMFGKVCKTNSLNITRILSKYNIKIEKKVETINKKIDNIDNKLKDLEIEVKKNTNDISNIKRREND